MNKQQFLKSGWLLGIFAMFVLAVAHEHYDIPFFCWECYSDWDMYWEHFWETLPLLVFLLPFVIVYSYLYYIAGKKE